MKLRAKLVRRLTVLAAALALFGGSAAAFFVYRHVRVTRAYKQMGVDGMLAASKADAPRAVELLWGYLQRYPEDTAALEQYSRFRQLLPLPRGQHLRDAIFSFRQLLRLQTRPDDKNRTRLQLLNLYADPRLGFWTEADQLAGEMIKDPSRVSASDLPVLAPWTRARLALDPPSALPLARSWSRLAPGDVEAQVTLLQLMSKTGKFDGFTLPPGPTPPVVAVAESLVAALQGSVATPTPGPVPSAPVPSAPGPRPANDDPRPCIIRGYGLMLAGKSEAFEQFQAAASAALPDRRALEFLVFGLDQFDSPQASTALLKRYQAAFNDPTLHDPLIRRTWESGDYKAVAALQADPALQDSEVLALRADALNRLGRAAEALPLISDLAHRADDPAAIAWAHLLSSSPASRPSADTTTVDCEAALKQRNSPYLQLFLARAYAAQGRKDQAIQALRRSLSLTPVWPAPAVDLSTLLADTGQWQPALASVREGFKRAPRVLADVTSLLRVWDGCIHNLDKSFPESFLQVADQVLAQAADDGAVLTLKVDVLATTKRAAEAAGVIRRALADADPSAAASRPAPAAGGLPEPVLLQLAAISARYKLGLEDACLDRCQAQHGMTAGLALARASLLNPASPADGLRLIENYRAKAKDPDSAPWLAAWCRYLDLVSDPRAPAETARLAQAYPDDVQVQLQVLRSAAAQADRPLLERAISQTRRLTGDTGTAWRLARAGLILSAPDPQPADLNLAKAHLEFVLRASESLEARVLLSRFHERQKDLPQAIEQMRAAVSLNRAAPALGLDLARLLELNGEAAAARAELARVTALPALDPAQRRSAAVLAELAGDARLALSLADDLSADRLTARDLPLARAYWRSGRTADADRVFRRLLDSDPDPRTVAAAADFFTATGRPADATTALARLDHLNVGQALKEQTRAEYFLRHGDPASALDCYKRAAELAPSDSRAWRSLIAFYLAAARGPDASDALARARRQLPSDPGLSHLQELSTLLLAAARRPDMQPFAFALANDPADLASEEMVRACGPEFRDETPTARAERIRRLANRYPTSLHLQIYCIAAYAQDRRLGEAAAAARRATEQLPGVPELHKIYNSVLESQKRWPEALAEAQNWRETVTGDPLDADLHAANALIQLHRGADAARALEHYADGPAATPETRAAVASLYSQALTLTGTNDEARIFEPLLSQGPAGRARWIQHAVEKLDHVKAVAWLTRARQAIPPGAADELIFLAQAWARLPGATPSDLASARQILQPLSQPPDAPLGAVLAFAMQQEAEGRPDDAAALYRRVLRAAPDEPISKNNLASILASTGQNLDEAAALARGAIASTPNPLNPNLPSFYDTLANVLFKQQKFAQAAQAARTALQLRPAPQYLLTLGNALVADGKKSDARQALRDFDEKNPDLSAETDAVKQNLDALRHTVGA